MLSPKAIISWLSSKVSTMRLSRIKTLAALVSAAMRRRGVGVLALGRAMISSTTAKHNIKRVWRFVRNQAVESQAVSEVIFHESVPARGPVVVLIDWTDMPPYRSLILALARRGRAIPFYSLTVAITGAGGMIAAEKRAVAFLQRCLPAHRHVIIVGDRGFGTVVWIRRLTALGWHYVLRLKSNLFASGCKLRDLGVRRGSLAVAWGAVRLTNQCPVTCGLVSTWRAEAAEPWFLATSLEGPPRQVVKLYAKRMWIELTIRDLKNRRWGMGFGEVRLSDNDRMDRLAVVVMLAYFFLCAYGAVAQRRGMDKGLKANTTNRNVLSLATIGLITLNKLKIPLQRAIKYFPKEIKL